MISRLMKWIEGPRLLVLRSLEAAQLSLTAERKDRRQCHQQKLRDMHSEAVHAKDSSSVLWQESWGMGLKLALHSDSTS